HGELGVSCRRVSGPVRSGLERERAMVGFAKRVGSPSDQGWSDGRKRRTGPDTWRQQHCVKERFLLVAQAAPQDRG
ncbi:MAG: hypothetical protein AB7V59_18325, partial [Gammaproteobacteria bacterium]